MFDRQDQRNCPVSDHAGRSDARPSDLAALVAQVCRDFAAAWKAGGRPSIESSLQEAPAAARATLLRELLRIELAHRWRNNERPVLEQYLALFPDQDGSIQAVFRDAPTAGNAPPTALRSEQGGEAAAGWPAIPGYEVLAQLSPGGMGIVYRARQVDVDRTVALKMMRSGLDAGPEERARFRVEAEAIASLSHPHIIQIHACGEWNGQPFLAMEFAEGGSLAQRLEGGPLPPASAAELVETLARAVQFVHEHGIIHRDLKPANVLLTELGVPKLADFGLAKRPDQDQGLTRSQAVLGTASYMAPEQAAGNKQALGPAADIYALGAILYEVLTGQPPFRAETRELTIHQVLSEEPHPPTRVRSEVPAELDAICLKCLEKEPGRRYASALALADDLRRYQNREPISIPCQGIHERRTRLARRQGYEIREVLASEGHAVVYKATHLALQRTVVLEFLPTREHSDAEAISHFRSQAEAAAQLHHPNIVELYDFGELDGEPFIAREYVEGHSLSADLAGPAPPADQTAALVETLARAVQQAHLQRLVHGHLEAGQVLRQRDGTLKLLGFGPTRSQTGSPAPEQLQARLDLVGAATDVYALGLLLFELVARRPLPPDTEASLRTLRPEVPADLDAICRKCLEEEPAARYPSAAALAEDLRRFREGEVLFIADLDAWDQQLRWGRRAGYEILERLGEGEEGFTYRARQLTGDRMVVLKRISARYRFTPGAKDRFRWEARVMARLRHRHIVQLHDQGEQNDLAYYAREFVEGPSLAQLAEGSLAERGRRSVARTTARLMESLARTLQAVHAAGVIHGGLHPSIIRLPADGHPRITSFRRVRLASGTQPESDLLRRAAYLAPEQFDGTRRHPSPAVDVYALGAILFTLLAGRLPFVAPTLEETARRVGSEPVRFPEPPPPMLSELSSLCLGCLEKDPGKRPPSALALSDALGILAR
jgi:serine/threonine protein kinase